MTCTVCGAQIPPGAMHCPGCGRSLEPIASPAASTPSMQPGTSAAPLADNVAGALAYVTIIPAVIFLILAPYNTRRFVRFHSFQCLGLAVAWVAVRIVLGIFIAMFWHMGFLLGFFAMAATIIMLVNLALLCIWILCIVKAYQGSMFKLPIIGQIADQMAGK